METDEITRTIIGCAYEVSNTLGCGFMEKVYENALAFELRKAGLKAEQQYAIPVRYKDMIAGDFAADILVEGSVLIELKVVKMLEDVHIAQCLNYLKGTGLSVCLLFNFYRPKIEIKRIVQNFKSKEQVIGLNVK
jgi:GxxExxY protein